MDLFIKSGKKFNMGSVEETFQQLPKGTYILEMDPNSGAYFLEKTEELKYPSKLYGNFDIVDRWINTYEKREGNLGILLSGLKGSGKTITAKMLAVRANKPIILVKAPFSGIGLKNFLADKRLGDCVIFIDEFEKIYEDYGNVDFLEILDGTASTHHMFVFTVNDENISNKMINRPSRIFYRKRYKGLDEKIVKEVGEDLLENKENMENLIDTMDDVEDLSYDILISVIGEMNRYNMPASEAIKEMCVDKKDRVFYLFEKLKINGNNYFVLLEGCRGKSYTEFPRINCNAISTEIKEDPRYSNIRFFGLYNQEDVAIIDTLGRVNYRLSQRDLEKLSKNFYFTNPDKTGGHCFVVVESKSLDYFEGGTVFDEEDFSENILNKPSKSNRGDKGQFQGLYPMECCAG